MARYCRDGDSASALSRMKMLCNRGKNWEVQRTVASEELIGLQLRYLPWDGLMVTIYLDINAAGFCWLIVRCLRIIVSIILTASYR